MGASHYMGSKASPAAKRTCRLQTVSMQHAWVSTDIRFRFHGLRALFSAMRSNPLTPLRIKPLKRADGSMSRIPRAIVIMVVATAAAAAVVVVVVFVYVFVFGFFIVVVFVFVFSSCT